MAGRRQIKGFLWSGIAGIAIGVAVMLLGNMFYTKSSTNESCISCHYHSEADEAWKQSSHYNNPSGTKTDCAQCHLPPEGQGRFAAKTRLGLKDLWSYIFKKSEDIDWAAKRDAEYARKMVFGESCKSCHVNLFPEGVTDDGITAHLYYENNERKLDLQCISCHLDVGHPIPGYSHKKMT